MTHSHHVHVSMPASYSHSHHHVSMPAASPAMTHSHHHSGGQHHHHHQQHGGGHHHHHHHHGQQPAAVPGFPVPYAYPPPGLASTTEVAPVFQPTRASSDRAKTTIWERICTCVTVLIGAGIIIFVFVINRKNL